MQIKRFAIKEDGEIVKTYELKKRKLGYYQILVRFSEEENDCYYESNVYYSKDEAEKEFQKRYSFFKNERSLDIKFYLY